MTKEYSRILYILKAFALVSIVTAHTYYTEIQSALLVRYIHRFSTAGVFCFFFLSGFFFHPGKGKASFFLKKKCLNLVCPWLFCSSLYFFLLVLMKTQSMSLMSYLNFVLGNGSYLYYMTMLSFCYGFFWYFYLNQKLIFFSIALTVISVFLTAASVFPGGVFPDRWIFSYFNPYLNPLNWLGIFGFGMLCQTKQFNLNRIIDLTKKHWAWLLLVSTAIFGCLVLFDNGDGYWSWFSLIIEASICLGMLCLSCAVAKMAASRYIEIVGQLTLPVYLLHMPIQNRLFSSDMLRSSLIFVIIRPLATIILMSVAFLLIIWLLKQAPKSVRMIGSAALGLHIEA